MILPFGFLYTTALVATIAAKHRSVLVDAEPLFLRGPERGDLGADVAHVDMPLLAEWGAARSALIRLRNQIGAKSGNQPVLGKAAIFALKPGEWSDWRIDEGPYADAHLRLHTTLIPSEDPRLFSGSASVSPAVGHVLVVDHRRPYSELNLGSCAWVQLVVDVRRGDVAPLEEPVDDPV